MLERLIYAQRKRLVWLGVAGVFAAAFLVLVSGSIENGLVFQPTRELTGEPWLVGVAYEDILVETADGVEVHGWFLPGDGPLTILYLHGNGGNLSHRFGKARCLLREGHSVFLIDYRGYGLSGGKPTEEGLYRDALAFYGHLVEERRIPPDEIVIWGASLGGAVAADLAARVPARALILESTFPTLRSVVRVAYPFLPSRLVQNRFDSIDKLRRLELPKLVIHGGNNGRIPTWLGQELYLAAAEPKELYIVAGAGHSDTLEIGGSEYLIRIEDFLRSTGSAE